MTDRVWYLAYGSNVNLARFRRYLEGDDSHQGARDPSPPTASLWASLSFELTFERSSQRWSGGGVAFVHPSTHTTAWFRGWEISTEQFEDVFAQENRLDPGTALDWDALRRGPIEVGTGWYRRVLPLDLPASLSPARQQLAMTFTATERATANAPHDDYADTIAAGLAENPELSDQEISNYLDRAISPR